MDFEKDRDARTLARKQTTFFRSIFTPTLAVALERVHGGDPDAYAAFADRLTSGLERRLRSDPAHMHSLVQILVMTKTN